MMGFLCLCCVRLNTLMLSIFQDYENRIQSLQEQVERHSMISSVATTNFFDDEEEEEEGSLSLSLLEHLLKK